MQKKSRFFYGWVIVAVAVLVFALGYGVRYSFSVIFLSLLEEFHWPRDATAAALSIHLLSYGITAPIAGAMVDRLGPRKTMGLGAVLLATGAAIAAMGSVLWHFYLAFGLFMGVGLCLMASVPFTRVLSNWFITKRGLALSLMFFGSGGPYLLYPLVAFLTDRIGWRGAFLVEAAMVAGLLLPLVVFLVRNHPQEMGLLPDGSEETAADAKAMQNYAEAVVDKRWAATDWTLLKAVKTFRFWALCFTAFAVWGITQHVLVTHHIAFAQDVGYSRLYASSVLALFGVFMSLGALVGFISDRIGRETTFSIGTVIGVSGIIALILVKDTSHPWMLYLYTVLFGLGLGMTSPTLAAAATDMFQGRRAGAVIGFVWFLFSVGGAIGPWLGGAVFEAGGSYLPAFGLAASMFALACLSLWIASPRLVRLAGGRAKSHLRGRRSSDAQG